MNAQGASPLNLVDREVYRRRRDARREPGVTAPPEPLLSTPVLMWVPFYWQIA